MITLYQFPAGKTLPNMSPFCMKLETYLRMAKLPYEIVTLMNPSKAPKGKLPYIKDGDIVIGDSGLIIDYLQQKYGNPLDQHLTPLEKAQSLAWRRLMEEHLYWSVLYSRWIDEANWFILKKRIFGPLPFIVRSLVSRKIRKHMHQRLIGHGMGVHTQAEVYALGVQDLEAMAMQLGEKAFFMGDEPSSIDACVYAYLANLLYSDLHSPLITFVKSQANFVAYCQRMKERYYS